MDLVFGGALVIFLLLSCALVAGCRHLGERT